MSMTSIGETWTREPAAFGGFADAIGGVATIVLAILGLAGLFPDALAGIATIVFGVALLIQGGTLLSEYAGMIFPAGGTAGAIEEFGGNTLAALFLVGAAGIVLGILALIGLHPTVLIPVAIIAYGAALVLSSNAVWRLYVVKRALMMRGPESGASGGEILASEMASGSAGMLALAGLAAVVLGILAIAMTGANDVVLFLVALLVLGATLTLSGSTLTGTVLSFMPHWGPSSEAPRSMGEPPRPYGQTHPTQGEYPPQGE
jgi:hypothetical protein